MITQGALLYVFLIFGVVIFSLGLSSIAYRRDRNPILKYYVYYDVTFTLFITIWVFLFLLGTNFPAIADSWHPFIKGLDYAQMFLMSLLFFPQMLFFHELFACSHRNARNFGIGVLALANYWGILQSGEAHFILSLFSHFILVGIAGYCVMISLLYYRRSSKPYMRLIVILLGGSFILQAENSFFILRAIYLGDALSIVNTPLFPVTYLSASIICGIYFVAEHLKPHHPQVVMNHPADSSPPETSLAPEEEQQQKKSGMETPSLHDFCEQHQLSAREKEVLLLLLQGRSNRQIAEGLFISLNTAKTHIRNIYQKTGINRRYELLAQCKYLSLLPSEEEIL